MIKLKYKDISLEFYDIKFLEKVDRYIECIESLGFEKSLHGDYYCSRYYDNIRINHNNFGREIGVERFDDFYYIRYPLTEEGLKKIIEDLENIDDFKLAIKKFNRKEKITNLLTI